MQALSDLVQEYITEVSWLALSCDHFEEMSHIQCFKKNKQLPRIFATRRIAQEHRNLVLSESFNISPSQLLASGRRSRGQAGRAESGEKRSRGAAGPREEA